MAEYIMLFRFTDKGVANIKDSLQRIKDAKKIFETSGTKVKSLYAVLGQYDTAWIIEAPNDETIAGLSLKIASQGNVHAETLRAFNEGEYASIVNNL